MNVKKKILIILIFFLTTINPVYSNEKIAFLDMEFVVKNSNVGKSVLTKINNLDKNNIAKLKIREKKLKDQEDAIKKKQNIISKEELDKEIKDLKMNLNNFRTEKNTMVNKINLAKKKELNNLYKKINPIIQSYMDDNNISILLDVKNIIIGRSNNNITNNILEEINSKLIE